MMVEVLIGVMLGVGVLSWVAWWYCKVWRIKRVCDVGEGGLDSEIERVRAFAQLDANDMDHLDISSLQAEITRWSESRGWQDEDIIAVGNRASESPDLDDITLHEANAVSSKLALVHSEVSEALEDLREGRIGTRLRDDGKPEGLASELADVVIRVLNLADMLGIDMASEIRTKMDYNWGRSYKHGGKVI